MSRSAVALLGVALATSAFGAEPTRASLGGISLGDSRAVVEKKLGEPLRKERTNDLLDPQYHYAGLVIGFYAEGDRSVGHVRSTGAKYCSDMGLCPGMSLERANAVLEATRRHDPLVSGDNQIKVTVDTCWLSVHIARGRVEWLALDCQV